MSQFLNLVDKTINDLALLPNILRKAAGVKVYEKSKVNNKETYGGFANSDWQKISSDMKRGLITFGKRENNSRNNA